MINPYNKGTKVGVAISDKPRLTITKEELEKNRKIVRKLHKDFIKKYRYNTNNDPIIINKLLRYILRIGEGQDVLIQAEKIMSRIVKRDL